MLVSKNKAINSYKSEKQTLFSFFLLYSFFSIIILGFSAYIYYSLQKELMLEGKTNILQNDSFKFISRLKYLHEHFDEDKTYPRFAHFRSAIYDSDKKLIFTTLHEENVNLDKTLYTLNGNIHYVRLLESYYLGAMYVVIEIDENVHWFNMIQSKMIVIGGTLFLLLLFVGYFLLRMMLKPMRESLKLLDYFIKDTTHELNTPISAILTNIEMIDESKLEPNIAKKIHRIDIASRTISNIYNDLTYTALGNRVISHDENVDLYALFEERIEFFKVISSSKSIKCIKDLDKNIFLKIDRTKITRIIDNLLSNAIKYNKKNSFIAVRLRKNYFEIEDGGIGIDEKEIDTIFQRYTRLNQSEGGFGLGLNIVYTIAQEYNLTINFKSKISKGTKVRVSWEK